MLMKQSARVAAITAACALTASSASAAVIMPTVPVGNAGNANDPGGGQRGAVSYQYDIGIYEVTNAQYAEFLNAVAQTDSTLLYNDNMQSNAKGGIIRSGAPGSYTYATKDNMGNKPVNFVSWYNAARMANWMSNGQGSGDTESGVYTLTGSTTLGAITRDPSNPDQYFIPTTDEWYKAAYHQPASQGGDTDDYWNFGTGSNDALTIATATITGDVANPGPNTVNHANGADWNGQDGNVTTVGSAGATSFYGAYDMSGNVWEWNEDTNLDNTVNRQGSAFNGGPAASNINSLGRSNENVLTGFRLGRYAPAPSSALLLAGGVLMLSRRRNR